MHRQITLFDAVLAHVDQALRTLAATAPASRPMPTPPMPTSQDAKKPSVIDERDRTLAGNLMRVNHAGEVAAQALYHGQAAGARAPRVRAAMLQAAREENDHLAWTTARLQALGTHRSVLNPVWYAGSFVLGYTAGLVGDRFSLGFLAETETQVVAHLDRHLAELPTSDLESRAVLQQMRADEAKHATQAVHAGGMSLPFPIRRAMRFSARIMTGTARWL